VHWTMSVPQQALQRDTDRFSQLVSLFENGIIYTSILRNIDGLIDNKDASIVMIVAASAILSVVLYRVEQLVLEAYPVTVGGDWGLVVGLLKFWISTGANVVVQLTSSMAATLAIEVYTDAGSIVWGMFGALLALSLLWLLQESAKKHRDAKLQALAGGKDN
jgi:hypothetical protein